jgi:hypothetical protein
VPNPGRQPGRAALKRRAAKTPFKFFPENEQGKNNPAFDLRGGIFYFGGKSMNDIEDKWDFVSCIAVGVTVGLLLGGAVIGIFRFITKKPQESFTTVI